MFGLIAENDVWFFSQAWMFNEQELSPGPYSAAHTTGLLQWSFSQLRSPGFWFNINYKNLFQM